MIRINPSEVSQVDGQLIRRLLAGGRVGHVVMAEPAVAAQLNALANQMGEEPVRYGDILSQPAPDGPLNVRELVAYLWHYRTLLIS
jgi:hypothetical protein